MMILQNGVFILSLPGRHRCLVVAAFQGLISISRDRNYLANVREDEARARFGEGATLKIPDRASTAADQWR